MFNLRLRRGFSLCLSLMTIGLLFLLPGSLNAQTGSTLRVDPADTTLEVGQSVNVTIALDVEGGRSYGAGSYRLAYDPAILSLDVDSFQIGTGLFGAPNTSNAGEILFNALSIAGSNGTVTLATATFTAQAVGESALTLTNSEDLIDPIGTPLPNLVVTSGRIVVESDDQSGPTDPACTISVGDLGRGIAGWDQATGSGFMMYSAQAVQDRFPGTIRSNADHFVPVIYSSADGWLYDANADYIPFTPQADDILVAAVDFGSDVVTSLEGTNSTIEGITAGYASGDIEITPNRWNGNNNNGEFGITGTEFVKNDCDGGGPTDPGTGTCTTYEVGDLGKGIAAQDNASGSGYVMYSAESVSTRFPSSRPPSSGAKQFIVVIYDDSNGWQYDSNLTYVPFSPVSTDILVAAVDFDSEAVNMLAGTDTVINGITAGYEEGDINVLANTWNGASNNGEFGVEGTEFKRDCGSSGGGNCALTIGDIGNGIPGFDPATGSGYIMYSATELRDRFDSLTVASRADRFIAVRYNDGQWELDTNSGYLPFTPVASDLLVAEVDFSADTVNLLSGTSTTINGIEAGYLSSDLVITPNQWRGSTNAGEWGISVTTLEKSCS